MQSPADNKKPNPKKTGQEWFPGPILLWVFLLMGVLYFVRTGNVPPGYCGGLIFGLKNEGPITCEIEMGARFVHIQFSEVKGGGNMYRGQWQGGRVTAHKKEKQV